MKHILLIALTIGITTAYHDYFEYEDCGVTCTSQRSSCIISESETGKFITKCTDSEECRASENNNVVCLMPGEPPLGGQDLWPDFQHRVYPSTTPRPDIQNSCKIWKIMSSVSLSCSSVMFMIFVVRKILTKLRSRRVFERIVTDDHPYQDTVQNVENDEE